MNLSEHGGNSGKVKCTSPIGYYELTPLHAAIQNDQSESVKLLIARGANVYLATEGESSPLFLAALYAGVEIGEMLLEAGAEIDDGNPKKRTPLHAAAVTGNVEMLNLLLEKSPGVQPDDALFEESDDQDEPPLIGGTAITIISTVSSNHKVIVDK